MRSSLLHGAVEASQVKKPTEKMSMMIGTLSALAMTSWPPKLRSVMDQPLNSS